MRKNYNILVIILILATYDCGSDKIDKSIVLKIGSLEITRYEFDRNFNRELSESDRKKKKIVSRWKQEYIDRCILTAYAYDLDYDTINTLQAQINQFADIMMVQRYGYLWRHNISPIVDTAKIITEKKVKNRSKLFYCDVITFKNLSDLLKASKQDTILDNLAEFTSLKEKATQCESFSCYYKAFQWPFVIFWDYRDYLLTLKEGNISKLLRIQDDYCYIYIDYIETVDVTDKDKNQLFNELQYGTEKELDDKNTIEIEKHCKADIKEELIDTLKYIMENKGKYEIADNFRSLKILKYHLKGEMKNATLADILEFYNQLPFKYDSFDNEVLISLIQQYYYKDYLLYQADSIGLFKTDEFILDRKNYQNNMIYSHFLNTEIYEKIIIDSIEIRNYYENSKKDFSCPENVIVDIYVFKNLQEANQGMIVLNNHITNNLPGALDKDQFTGGIHEIKPNVNIELKNNTQYSKIIIDILENISVGKVYREAVKMEEFYLLLHKVHENGMIYKDLTSVQNQITNILREEKANEKRKALLEEIPLKYPVEIDKTGI